MKTDILTVIDTNYDDSTGFYVNEKKVADVHCNDESEIPNILYEVMVKYNILKVEHRKLSEKGWGKYYQGGNEHPDTLQGYCEEDFE